GYQFRNEKALAAEKGKYVNFPMTLSQNRKAMAIVHESVLNHSEYVLSFNANPVKEVAQLLGGAAYGLHILPEWEQPVVDELILQQHLVQHELYVDENLFADGLSLLSINLTEEEADLFIENMIKNKRITFPASGDGTKVQDTEDLTSYLMEFNQAMVEK